MTLQWFGEREGSPARFGATPLLLAAFVAALLFSCQTEFGGKWGKKKEGPPAPAPVTALQVQRGDISSYFRFHAALTATREVNVFSQTVGIVVKRLVEEEDWAAAGQLLAQLEDSEQKLALDRAQTALDHQQAEATRAEDLFGRGMLPDDDIRRARLAQKEAQFNLDQAHLAFNYTRIKAPFAGTITRRSADVGDRVDPSRPLFTIVDRSTLFADGWVSEVEVLRLRVGEEALVLSPSDSTAAATARIVRIGSVVDPALGKIKVSFAIPGNNAPFKPGQYVEVRLILETHRNAPLAPKRAILYEAGAPVVFIVQDSLALRRPVRTGISEGGMVELTAGLQGGEWLVVDGHTTLRDSSKVRLLAPSG